MEGTGGTKIKKVWCMSSLNMDLYISALVLRGHHKIV